MENMQKDLSELFEMLSRALKEANEKLRSAGGKLSTSDLDYVNKLSHSLKSIKATIKMIEDEEMEDGGSYGDGSYRMRGYSRNDYRGSYDDGSYARGRGRYANRDAMGRYSSRDGGSYGYSRDGYSGHGDMVEELRELMQDAPNEQLRQEMQRLIEKMEKR